MPHDRSSHLLALTGVRFFAALWVVLYHFQASIEAAVPGARALGPLTDSGYLGVDLFFCLSGFILSYNYLHRLGDRWRIREHGRFLWLRFARVWPVHVFTLHIFVLMLALGGATGFTVRSAGLRTDPGAYLENLLLIHVWFGQALSFNGPSWSVSAEWFAYLLFPLLAPLVTRVKTLLAAVAGALATYGLLLGVWFWQFWDDAGATTGALVRVELGFIAGCFLFLIWDKSRPGRSWDIVAAVALVLIGVGAWYVDEGHTYHGILLAPLFGVLVLALGRGRGTLSRFLATGAAVFGGEVSYSLYMTHGVVQPVANKLFSPAWLDGHSTSVAMAAMVAIAGLIAVPAVLTYLYVEKPSRDLLRSLTPGRPGS